ncbi:MAG: enoyl-CoA hydratase/isomerase family protein [Chloroflexi bacterium]|nr:enoyl-CoA hydratase/isomerase family protein [Chloroflexota bacterium]
MPYQHLNLEREQGVGIINLNRPPVNSLDIGLVAELGEAGGELASDPTVRAILVRSAIERFFAAGADIKAALAYDEPTWREYTEAFQHAYNTLEQAPKPVIAAINGHALGGGCELALACDFRLMASGPGRIGVPEVTLGLMPGAGGASRLPRLIGRSRGTEMLLTGRTLTAQEALEWGLVHRVYADEAELRKESWEFAQRMARQATVAIAWLKRMLREGLDRDLASSLELEREGIVALAGTRDLKEGMTAFMEKRSPEFRGS